MNESTEWWQRAATTLQDTQFRREVRQVHGLAGLIEYAPDPIRARESIPFTYNPDRLFEAALQIFIAASLEIEHGTPITDSQLNEAFRLIGQLMYFLEVGEQAHFQQRDLLIRAALAFDLAGHSANSYVALALRNTHRGPPTTSDYPDVELIVNLYLSRQIAELRRLNARWQLSLGKEQDPQPRFQSYIRALSALSDFVMNGSVEKYDVARERVGEVARFELVSGSTNDWYLARGLELAIGRLRDTSVWLTLENTLGPLSPLWQSC